MRKAEHQIKIEKLVIIFNSRYSITFNKERLKRACKRVGIEIHMVRSPPPNYGRSAMAIMTEDVPRLEAEIKSKMMQDISRLPVDDEQSNEAIRRIKNTGVSAAEIARRAGINEGTLSEIINGKQVMRRGKLAKIKRVLKEIEE